VKKPARFDVDRSAWGKMKIKPLLLLAGAVTALVIMLAASHWPASETEPEPYRISEDMAETMAGHGIEINQPGQVRPTATAYQPPQ
jgi:hypothetical protein